MPEWLFNSIRLPEPTFLNRNPGINRKCSENNMKQKLFMFCSKLSQPTHQQPTTTFTQCFLSLFFFFFFLSPTSFEPSFELEPTTPELSSIQDSSATVLICFVTASISFEELYINALSQKQANSCIRNQQIHIHTHMYTACAIT